MADDEHGSVTVADEAATRLDQVADAAMRRFARYGFKRSSMEDIAREAGLAKATLYLHFKGKDDVFRAMLRRFTRVTEARCLEVMAQPLPFAEKFAALMEAHFVVAYETFGTNEHLMELKAVMAAVAAAEMAAFDRIFADNALRLLQEADAVGEIALDALAPEDVVTTATQAAIGAKYLKIPSCETYAGQITRIAAVTARTVARR